MTLSYFDTANKLKLEGKLEEAIASYHQAIEEKPNFYWSYQNLGDALAKLGRCEEAVNAYQSAIELNSSLPWVHYSLGEAWEKLGRLDEAIACYKKAIELNPEKEWEINRTLGKVLQRRSEVDLANAIAMYRRIIELNPGSVKAYQNLLRLQSDCWELWGQFAQVLVQENQIEGAIAAYQKVMSLNPDYVETYEKLKQLQPSNWESWYSFKVAPDPNLWQAHYNQGNILLQEGKLDAAIKSYDLAIATKSEGSSELAIEIGMRLLEWEKLDKALVFWEKSMGMR